MFFASGRHSDGSLVRLIFQCKLIKMLDKNQESDSCELNKSHRDLLCIWISRDPFIEKSMFECSILDHSNVSLLFIFFKFFALCKFNLLK
jgi:hypothetical protein